MPRRFRVSGFAPVVALLFAACGSHSVSDGGADGGADARDAVVTGDTPASNDVNSDAPLPTATASTWLGTNVSGDLPFVDVTRMMNAFDTPAAQKDANGYPVAGAMGTSDTDLGFVLPTGQYAIAYSGDGTVTVSGIASLTTPFTTSGTEHRGVLTVTATPGVFGRSLRLTVVNGAGGTPVHGLRILMPGQDVASTQVFTPQFLALLRPFRALRMMEWESTNGSTLANWADRSKPTLFGTQAAGVPYETLAELANQTGKDLWVTIPEHATDDFVTQFAHLLRTTLDFTRIAAARHAQGIAAPFQLIVEYSNETWNPGFSAYRTFLTAAMANPSRYDGHYTGTYGPSWMTGNTDLMRVGQYEADGLMRFGAIFRTEFAMVGMQDAIAPVLSGWSLGAGYTDDGLQFIHAHGGDPGHAIRYVAIAPYVGPVEDQTGSLDALFTSLEASIHGMDTTFQDFARLVAAEGVQMAAYEGGQGLSGTNNQMIKHLAQHDVRMHTAYVDLFALWRMRFGDALFMHFDLAGTPGIPETIFQYGYWGSIAGVMEDTSTCGQGLRMLTGNETIASVQHACPKYQALTEQVGN